MFGRAWLGICLDFWKAVAQMTDYIVPCLMLLVCLAALRKKENAYDLLLSGATDGLKLLISLVPALILLLTAVTMLRASGAMELIGSCLAPVFRFFDIPEAERCGEDGRPE